jgi:predicted PurR-regulated permease PerM
VTQDLRLVAIAVVTVVLLWVLYMARWGILFVYVAVLIATGVRPLVNWIQAHTFPGTRVRPPRWLAAGTVYLVGVAVVIGIASAVIPPLVTQAQELAENLPSLIDRSQSFLLRHRLLSHRMPMDELVQQVPSGAVLVGTVLSGFGSMVGALFAAVLVLVLSFYLVNQPNGLFTGLIALVPRARRSQVRSMLAEATDKIGAWMMGQLMLSVIIGSTAAAALGLLGIPYFFVLAVVAAVGELVPFAGPLIAAVPAVALAATVSWEMAFVVAGFYLLQQQFENHLLVPKLMQHQVGLSPAWVIIAVTIGSMLLGILGAILAVPTAAIVQVALAQLREEN